MKRLTQNLNSAYIEAMNRLGGRHAREKIVAYVESYDDVFFWSSLLRPLETPDHYFEVMLPSRTTLCKGKKTALANELGPRLGRCMIACVDADYDYLMQGATPTSKTVCENPYVFHTYVYAIENFQCFAPALHNVCVMVTLNDARLFDFEEFMRQYSLAIWPLLVWNVWCYRYGHYKQFSMLDFYHVVQLNEFNFYHPELTIEHLRHLVNSKVARLQRQFPEGRTTYKPLREELLRLGLTPETAYLFMRGHDLFDGIVSPLLASVCEMLRRHREHEIRRLAEHNVQMQNELSAYQNATASIEEMLRKHTLYADCPLYRRVQDDVRQLLRRIEQEPDSLPAPAVPELRPELSASSPSETPHDSSSLPSREIQPHDHAPHPSHGVPPMHHGGDRHPEAPRADAAERQSGHGHAARPARQRGEGSHRRRPSRGGL